jgi:nitrogen-specific signal transduction histidine kinase
METERHLEMERERRLMYDAIWQNPHQNDSIGLVEVEFQSPTSPLHPTQGAPADLVIFEMNAKAAARFRRTPETVRGMKTSELILEQTALEQFLEPYKRALESGEPQFFEHSVSPYNQSHDERSSYTLSLVGKDSYFKTTVTHIGTNRLTGNPICCFFESNVTRYKKQERELVAKNAQLADALFKAEVASKSKDDFLGMVSHEYRTPLNGILGHLALLKETPLLESQLEHISTISDCSEGLLSLVNDILDLSRASANKIELDDKPFDLHGVMRTSFAIYKTAEPRIKMVWSEDGVPEWCMGDGKRLRQVVINLLR